MPSLPPLEPVEDGDWRVQTVSPRTGPTGGETLVSLLGNFPTDVDVWFGDTPGTIVLQLSSWILVDTPRVGTAGLVDMTLRTGSGEEGTVLTIPDAFLFVDPDPGSGGSSGGGGSGGGSGGSGSGPTTTIPGATTTTQAGSGQTPTTVAPSTTTTIGSTTTTAIGSPRNRSGRVGDPVDLNGGIRGQRLDGLDGITGTRYCNSDPCPVERL